MVADRLKIQTYKVGHQPLDITIEGLTKYFIIKLIDEPPRTDFPKKPASDSHDGPPQFPGTRVTVYLRPDVKVDIRQTLDTFAANIDYSLTIYEPVTIEPAVIYQRRWESEDAPFDTLESALEIGYQALWPVAGLVPRKLPSKQDQVLTNLKEVLVYSRIPFENYAFSQDLKGSAWFWLLRDADGGVCPRRGNLSIASSLHLTGAPHLLQKIAESLSVQLGSDEWQEFLPVLRTLAATGESPDAGTKAERTSLSVFGFEQRGADAYVKRKEFFDDWKQVSPEERFIAVQSLESLTADADLWCEVPGIMSQLLLSKPDWSHQSIRFDCPLGINTLPQSLALHGIRLPAGFVKWNPMRGESVRLKLLEFVPAGVLVDVRGDTAPIPTASRLAVLHDEAKKAALPLLRGCLYHALQLARSESDESGWREWLDGFLDSLRNLEFWPEIINQEYDHLEAQIKYSVIIDHQLTYLPREQLLARFGRWVPFWDGRFSEEGLWAYRGGSQLLSAFKPRRHRSDNVQEADFEGKVKFEGDRLEDLILRLQQDVLYR